MNRKRKWILRIALVALVLFLVSALAAFLIPKKFLCVDSGPVKADVMIVLGGGGSSHDRAKQAVELFKQQAAPRIIISGAGDDDINRRVLIEAGIPAGVIQVESNSRTTKENAQFTVQLLRSQKTRSAIIVTSWYHSRRALRTFGHFAPEIQFYSCPSYFASTRADWQRERMSRRIYLEYPKLLGYWLRYGVWPF